MNEWSKNSAPVKSSDLTDLHTTWAKASWSHTLLRILILFFHAIISAPFDRKNSSNCGRSVTWTSKSVRHTGAIAAHEHFSHRHSVISPHHPIAMATRSAGHTCACVRFGRQKKTGMSEVTGFHLFFLPSDTHDRCTQGNAPSHHL